MVYLFFTNASELINNIGIEGCLGCIDDGVMMVEFKLLKETGQPRSKIRNLSFKKVKFQLFRELANNSNLSSKKGS